MSTDPPNIPRIQAVSAFLLGSLDFDTLLSAQHRLVYEVSGDPTSGAVIVCDHPSGITIGRAGSRAHVRLASERLAAREWSMRWIARGGGCVLHVPGQTACYPILSLERLGLTPAAYVEQLCQVIVDIAGNFSVTAEADPNTASVRVGDRRIAHVGVAVRNGVTSFGFVVNVAPDLELFRDIDCDGDRTPVGSLQRSCPIMIRPQAVRQAMLESLSARFGFGRISIFHHHPVILPRNHAVVTHHR